MIKLFVFSLLALVVGVYIQLQLSEDPGYVLISFKGYDIEATLGVAIISLLLIYVTFSGVIWLVRTFNPLKLFRKQTWLVFSGKKKAILGTEKGMQLLLLGHWQQAYKLLVENADKIDAPVINYIAASIAAFQHGDKVSWAYCLDRAEKSQGGTITSVRNLKAAMELKTGGLEQSLAILLALKTEIPNSPLMLNNLKEVYLALEDWDKLWQLLPELEKNKILKADELFSLTEKATIYRLEKAAIVNGQDELISIWDSLPKRIKASEQITKCYLDKLIEKGNDGEAVAILTRFQKKEWSDLVISTAGYIECKEPQRLLSLLESWSKTRTNNASLCLAIGRVSLRNQLWQKARDNFQNALLFSSEAELSAEINAELGRLLKHMGEPAESLAYYSDAIVLLDKKIPILPMPELALTKLPAIDVRIEG